MINNEEFRKQAHQFVDWMADYYQTIEELPVKSQVAPGEILNQLPDHPPQEGEAMDTIFSDFQKKILPGITHWQNPNFFGYFPANASYPSVLGEMLTATLGAQCMVWETSPAAAELEERVLDWLKEMTGLPASFHGVIQDTASTATLVALLTAREKVMGFSVNEYGFDHNKFRVYCSEETHSSIEKAAKIAGFGRQNLVKIPVNEKFRMDVMKLEQAVKHDLEIGMMPVCIVATLGTTGSTAIDPLEEVSQVALKYGVWLHVDAAFAGTALLLEEYRWMIKGIEQVDSFVFNPHKWMFTNFDCSAYFVRDKDVLINTFAINPEYLKTKTAGQVNDYRDWGIQLGRRFRALKLWFVIRNFGINGLKEKISEHIRLAGVFEKWIETSPDFEILAPRTLSLVCFRFKPENISDQAELNRLNEQLMHNVNGTGKIFITHTKLGGNFTLRMVIGQTRVKEEHVFNAWKLIREKSLELL